jgi:hypothetical protein
MNWAVTFFVLAIMWLCFAIAFMYGLIRRFWS